MTSRPRVSPWNCAAAGFLVGFLIVFGWQRGGYQGTMQPAAASGQAGPSSPVRTPATNGRSADRVPSPSDIVARLKAADDLLFRPRDVEQQLKGPLGRLEKFLQQCELKGSKSQQVGEPDGDTIVRIETLPFQAPDMESFWSLAEQELSQLNPGVQSFFIARVQNMQAQFFGQRQPGVLFVKQLSTRIPGQSSVQYWFFQTSTPEQYVLNQNGSIDLPAGLPMPQPTPWFDPSTYKPPQRLRHLAVLKYN